jgi:hypothetical protein
MLCVTVVVGANVAEPTPAWIASLNVRVTKAVVATSESEPPCDDTAVAESVGEAKSSSVARADVVNHVAYEALNSAVPSLSAFL